MKYTWDKDLLKKLKKDPEVKDELQELYMSLIDIFDILNNPHVSKKETVVEAYHFFKQFNFMEEYYNKAENALDIEPITQIPKIKLSQDDMMGLNHDFYKQTNPAIYKAFLKYFNQRFTHFKFYNPTKNAFYSGGTYVTQKADQVFIAAADTKNLAAANLVAHEYGHAVHYELFPDNYKDSVKAQFDEIMSVFMELLFLEYIESIPEFKDALLTEKKMFYITLLNDIEKINYQYKLAQIAGYIFENEDVPDMTFHKFFRYAKDELYITNRDLKEILERPSYAVNPYIIGGLTAIELWNIYKNDPDKAFYTLFKILGTKGNAPEDINNQIKELGVYPTQNIDTYARKLVP